MRIGVVISAVATLSLAVALAGCTSGGEQGASSEAKKGGPVLAEVNGSTITAGDFQSEVDNLPPYLKPLAQTPEGKKELLDNMVIRELVLQQAAKDGLDKGKELDAKLAELKKRLVVERFLKKKVEELGPVNSEELKKFYEQNKDKFKTGEQVRASHILVKTEPEAQAILEQLKNGAPFEQLAKAKSIDPGAAKGGDLGWFGKGNMVPEFEKVVFGLKVGELSGVIKTKFGYHVVKVTGKRPAGQRELSEVEDQIKAALMPQKQQMAFQKLKDDLKKNAKVTIKEDALKALDGGAGSAAAAPSGK